LILNYFKSLQQLLQPNRLKIGLTMAKP
jgi:hypothetical protein